MAKLSRDVNEIHHKTEADSFSLKLPTSIDATPWQEVDLPRNKKAMIYELMMPGVDKSGTPTPPAKRYDVYVVSKKNMSTSHDSYSYRSGPTFDNMPALKHWLYDTARVLSIKKQTRKVVNVQDVHEVDDDE